MRYLNSTIKFLRYVNPLTSILPSVDEAFFPGVNISCVAADGACSRAMTLYTARDSLENIYFTATLSLNQLLDQFSLF